uniref:Uncharacterized protein n=1 Tax=Anguilla anguilla TaxID=7936 RepID=A0A0E9SKJ1_ANGAN
MFLTRQIHSRSMLIIFSKALFFP